MEHILKLKQRLNPQFNRTTRDLEEAFGASSRGE